MTASPFGMFAAKSANDSGVGIGRKVLVKSLLNGGVGSRFVAPKDSFWSVGVVSIVSITLNISSCCSSCERGGVVVPDASGLPSGPSRFPVCCRVADISADFRRLAEELLILLMPELRFFRPALAETLYPHGAPLARQRAHSGLALLHLTLAIKQLSQDSRSLALFGGGCGGSGRVCIDTRPKTNDVADETVDAKTEREMLGRSFLIDEW